MEITGELVKSSIALALKEAFKIVSNDKTIYPTIYKEKIVKGMKKPAFFIWTLEVIQQKLMSNYNNQIHNINIRYYGNESSNYEELCSIANKLFVALEKVDMPIFEGNYNEQDKPIMNQKPIHGRQMSFTINEDVLQFFVTYTIKIKDLSDKEKDYMQKLTINNDEKEN